MQRVTFGVKGSPFLSMSMVQNHAERCKEQFPDAAREISQNIHVDDYLMGAENTDEAIELQCSLSVMMKLGGFQLNKWASNANEIVQEIKPEKRAPSFSQSSFQIIGVIVQGRKALQIVQHVA